LSIARDGHVETWTLDLPEARNPISGAAMIDALVDAARRANRDATVRAVVITGAGPAFSAGGNVKDMATGSGLFGHSPTGQRAAYRDGIQQIPRSLADCEVPLIAAVNGPAVGAGCDLALMCDLRVASTNAFFAENFVMLGLVPGDGGAWFLSRAVGAVRAAEMILTGKRIDAATALEWGLVNAVVPPESLLPAAYELAGQIAANPPHAVRMAKRLLHEARHGASLEAVLDLSAAMQALAHTTRDHHEAVDAFLSRRGPEFTGE
jgi:enoyl-CoA hydratase/carnithine racemase